MPHTITLPATDAPILRGHLRLGGANPHGQTLVVNSLYVERDGQPWLPVMGEFHYARYPSAFWDEELAKTRALGVDILATYVFWIHHEEDEGVFDWRGDRDLRRFVALCAKHQMQVVVRMGPFDHGEVRNGGLPDWLYGQPFEPRSTNPRFLAYVRRLYTQIAAQIDGLLYKDGGPVIAVQLDNEYMHCGAPWETTFRPGTEYVPAGREGLAYMAALKQIALDVGLDVPFYTCTGWLNSPVIEDELLPMQGGYAYTPWSPDPAYRQEPTREFLFRDRRRNPVFNGPPTYDPLRVPLACCEIGGGIQTTYYHRPIVPPETVEALAVMNLGDGANLIGYYMAHGGTNPVGKHAWLNEFTVPRLSYDFQAPLREYGQFHTSYRYLRLVHSFLRDFGLLLAPMQETLPDDAARITPEDTTALRWAVRSSGSSGFLFLNTTQDHVAMQAIDDVVLELVTPSGPLTIPRAEPFTLQANISAILPFGLSLDGVPLLYATAQPLMRIGSTFVFFAPRGMRSEYAFDADTPLAVEHGAALRDGDATIVRVTPGTDCVITLTSPSGKAVRILTLTREQAENASRHRLWGQDRLVITDGVAVGDDGAFAVYSTGANKVTLSVYPPTNALTPSPSPSGRGEKDKDGIFARYELAARHKEIALSVERIGADAALVTLPPNALDGLNDLILRVAYSGDTGNAFIDGVLVADDFCNGLTWEIGVRHVAERLEGKALLIRAAPMIAGRTYTVTGMASTLDAADAPAAEIRAVTAVPVYRLTLGLA